MEHSPRRGDSNNEEGSKHARGIEPSYGREMIQTMKGGLNMQEESNPHMGEKDNLIGEPNSEECDFFMYEKYVLIGLSYKYKHSESIDEVEGSFAFRRPPRREFFVSAQKP